MAQAKESFFPNTPFLALSAGPQMTMRALSPIQVTILLSHPCTDCTHPSKTDLATACGHGDHHGLRQDIHTHFPTTQHAWPLVLQPGHILAGHLLAATWLPFGLPPPGCCLLGDATWQPSGSGCLLPWLLVASGVFSKEPARAAGCWPTGC